MRIPLIRGRDVSDADGPNAANVAVVSAATAQKFWGSDDPIGRSIHAGARDYTVVGEVGDVRNTALNRESPTVYYSSAARVWPLMDVVVRTPLQPEAVRSGIRQKIRHSTRNCRSRTCGRWKAGWPMVPRSRG